MTNDNLFTKSLYEPSEIRQNDNQPVSTPPLMPIKILREKILTTQICLTFNLKYFFEYKHIISVRNLLCAYVN